MYGVNASSASSSVGVWWKMGRISAFPVIYSLRVGLARLGSHVTSAFYFSRPFISQKSCLFK
jgi:hypothetical protein